MSARYDAYLASPEWKAIRQRVLSRDGGRCRSCSRRANQVHHASYDEATMHGRDISRLFSLCGPCHLATTFTVTGERRTMAEVAQMAAGLNPPKRERRKKARKRKRQRKHKAPRKLRAYERVKVWRGPKIAPPMRSLGRSIQTIRIYDPKG